MIAVCGYADAWGEPRLVVDGRAEARLDLDLLRVGGGLIMELADFLKRDLNVDGG